MARETVNGDRKQTEYYINRELSWLEFNDRVLKEAKDKNNPLLERLKFLSIVSTNLDEFFMVRVASLKDQVNAGFNKKDPAGLTPKQQLKEISLRVHPMVYEQYNALNRGLLPKLKKNGLYIKAFQELDKNQKSFIQRYFIENIYPTLTPMAVDIGRPFPLILSKSLNIGVLLATRSKEKLVFATVQVPSLLPRLIKIPGNEGVGTYILLEELIKAHIHYLFEGQRVVAAYPYRITRNADLTIEEEEAEDLLIEIEKSLQKRKWAAAVRLEVEQNTDGRLVEILKNALEIHYRDIYYINGPIDLSFVRTIYSLPGFEHLKYIKNTSAIPYDFAAGEDIFEVIGKKDILLHHPYESFEPVVAFINRAAKDPKVLAIKQTLYRVSGDSPIVRALTEAAVMGKQVTVLVELKARFDEEINIQWAKQLEQAGCHVIYGLTGLKTHCKLTLVVRQLEKGICRYVHLGTGNYNDITAQIYTDISLFTCHPQFGADASAIFNMLSGYSQGPVLYQWTIAPLDLRKKFLHLIEREIKYAKMGLDAKIIAKMNSLVDTEIIEALYSASNAGVQIYLIVRGICCLRPGIKGVSENIKVRSIVGRFLEHSRIFYFFNNGGEEVFLSSADWMPRNLDRRVELLFPVRQPSLRERIIHMLHVELVDNVKARILNSDGVYRKIDKRGKKLVDCQEYFLVEAMKNAQSCSKDSTKPIFEPITESENLFL